MPGLVPGIHVLKRESIKAVDGRNKSGHDDVASSPAGLVAGAKGMRRIDAENLEVIGEEFELLERQLQVSVFRVTLDIGIELGGEEIALDHVALELGHVHAVGGE